MNCVVKIEFDNRSEFLNNESQIGAKYYHLLRMEVVTQKRTQQHLEERRQLFQ